MKKRIIFLFAITFIVIVTLSLNTVAISRIDDVCGENITYSYNSSDKELVISGKGPMTDYSAGESPFFLSDVEKVTIEKGVTTIGSFVFEGCRINSIVIPDSIESIGNRAFIDCDRLEEIILPDSISTIDEYAFFGCEKLKSVILPKNLIQLGKFAFSDNMSLQSVIIPSNLKSITENAFSSCSELKEVFISGDVVNIEKQAFKYCFALEDIYLNKSIVYIDESAFEYCCSLTDLYYNGNQTEWDNIQIARHNNEYLLAANNKYNSHIHNYSVSSIKSSTCMESGSISYACSCGDSIIKVIDKQAHNYEKNVTKATLKNNGSIKGICKNCKTKINEVYYYPKTIKLSTTKYTYNAKVKTPEVIVKDSKGNPLIENVDYVITYADGRKLPGKYIVVVKFLGIYYGEKKLAFTIEPKSTTGLKAKTQTTKTITLTWSKTTGATGYRVYQYSSSKGEYILKKSLTGTSYKVTGLKEGTSYKFKIRPYTKDNDGTVIWGADSKAFTTATKTATPTIKSVSNSSRKVTITWNNVSGESGYQIYYSTSKNGTYKKLASVGADKTKYTSDNLVAGKTYYFKVRAYKKVDDKTIYGDFCDVKSIKIPIVYYVTKSGKKYHIDGCRSLSKSKIQISYKDAVAKGYKPCSSCIK